MNTALALEHEAIWAYGLAGGSGLLSAKAKEVGLLFQGSHEIHRDLLVDAVKRKGGSPVEPKKEYVFGVPLANEKDVLELAFKLEVGAARVYLYVVDRFQDRALSGVGGADPLRRGPARDRAAERPGAGRGPDLPADRELRGQRSGIATGPSFRSSRMIRSRNIARTPSRPPALKARRTSEGFRAMPVIVFRYWQKT